LYDLRKVYVYSENALSVLFLTARLAQIWPGTLAAVAGEFQAAVDAWEDARIAQAGRHITMNVPARDAVVAMLR
jgi:hypothetical protein